ncbi:MAG TPA: Hsp20 family protein [Vitreimonas sp.]|nr:Hsp20 family protein [Vitreimonas sp.]
MSRPGPFGHPFCVGFDEVERLVERLARSQTDAYPPINIEAPAEGRIRLTLAVAGFAPDQLAITLTGRELTVRGERTQPQEGRTYLHKGIATRGFQRGFLLAENLDVEGAQLTNGLLRIELKRRAETHEIRQISITLG